MLKNTDDLRIKNLRPLISPAILIEELPIHETAADLSFQTRHAAEKIIHGRDDRLIVVVGPCSIHDPKAALEYATKLKPIADKYQSELLVASVLFEKPHYSRERVD